MPLLGSLLVSLVGSLAGFFAKYVGSKMAMGLASVAALGIMLTALLALMRSTIAALAPVIADNNFGVGLGIAIPPNASACFTAWLTVWSACTLYVWKKKALELFNQA